MNSPKTQSSTAMNVINCDPEIGKVEIRQDGSLWRLVEASGGTGLKWKRLLSKEQLERMLDTI